jgi:peroxiredoxin
LLSDTDREMSDAYGAARPPDDDAAAFARRLSYLVDPSGTVRRAYEVTDVASHPAELLDDLRDLQRS